MSSSLSWEKECGRHREPDTNHPALGDCHDIPEGGTPAGIALDETRLTRERDGVALQMGKPAQPGLLVDFHSEK